jgi:Flp pilus assembly protein TadG
MLDKGTLMPRNRRSNKGQKGFAFIYLTLVGTLVLLPMAGLAVDFGMLYNVKARLQTAVDAAAIGAGYMLHASTNISNPTQLAAIEASAQAYFNANFPPKYFGSTVVSYSAVVATTASGKTITVNASATVPMLLLRVLGIQASTVGALAVSNVRYIAMMIVVDRSGSVQSEPGAESEITTTLQQFVGSSLTSTVVDGVDTVGMVSFGASWKLDYAPNLHFQTATPNIATAISDIYFGPSSTNTAEGLYQAWTQLYSTSMNLPGSLNVILLLTDGRPSAFTGKFLMASTCNSGGYINGNLQSYVNLNGPYPFWPPPTTGNDVLGLLGTKLLGSYPNWTAEQSNLASPNSGCAFAQNTVQNPQPGSQLNINNDLPSGGNFPSTVGPVDNVGLISNPSYPYYLTPGSGVPTQSGYYPSPGLNSNDPRSVRYAAFNVADNMATMIRTDTTLSPMLFVIGLNYSTGISEPLDADWLARLANDPTYVTVGSDPTVKAAGLSVYQNGQTPGMYCGGTITTLGGCFTQVTSSLLRLIQ